MTKPRRSAAFRRWVGPRKRALDEMTAAHAAIGGSGRGRRYATQQVNQAYAMLLVAQFQGFCRDLHREAADAMLPPVPAAYHPILSGSILFARKLMTGNPNPGNIGSDYNRLGLDFWPAVVNAHPRAKADKDGLERLCEWRNAIAHQDFDAKKLGGTILRLSQIRRWRASCKRLARGFDTVLHTHPLGLTKQQPW